MKVSDVIKIAKPGFMPVKIIEKNRWDMCAKEGNNDCDGCEFCNDYEDDDGRCKHEYIEEVYANLFDGRCEEVPIKLGDKKVASIGVEIQNIRKHIKNPQLIIEVIPEANWQS